MKTQRTLDRLARQLDRYISARAEREGVGYELCPQFMRAFLIPHGTNITFGCEITNGRFVRDHQRHSDLDPTPFFTDDAEI